MRPSFVFAILPNELFVQRRFASYPPKRVRAYLGEASI